MSVRAIRLLNFRGFQDARIELKPLTVLLGPNSAGKSAFGHALAAMAHVHKLYSSTPQASLTPPPGADVDTWPVDLGETSDLRTEGAEGPVRIGLETTRGGLVELGVGGLDPYSPKLLMSYARLPSGGQSAPEGAQTLTAIESTPSAQRSEVLPGKEVFKIDPVIEIRKVNERQLSEG